jgi:hypothetical protein
MDIIGWLGGGMRGMAPPNPDVGSPGDARDDDKDDDTAETLGRPLPDKPCENPDTSPDNDDGMLALKLNGPGDSAVGSGGMPPPPSDEEKLSDDEKDVALPPPLTPGSGGRSEPNPFAPGITCTCMRECERVSIITTDWMQAVYLLQHIDTPPPPPPPLPPLARATAAITTATTTQMTDKTTSPTTVAFSTHCVRLFTTRQRREKKCGTTYLRESRQLLVMADRV